MTDKLHDALKRSRQAQELKDNELLQEAFAELEKVTFSVWADESLTPEDREQTHRRYKALVWLKKYIQATIDDGKVAQHELERLQKRQAV